MGCTWLMPAGSSLERGHWACRAGVTFGAWSLLRKETGRVSDWRLRGGKDRWKIRGYVGRRGELCVASIRAFLCGPLAVDLYFDCTFHRGYSFLPKPKPTMSRWLFQIITSSAGVIHRNMRPSSRLPVNTSHCHKINVVSSGYFLLSSTKDIQSFRR